MIQKNFTFQAPDKTQIYVYKWLPEGPIKAAINISHGMAETAARYERFAGILTNNGYAVYVADQRGHGKTIKDPAHAGEVGADAFNRMLGDLHQLSEIIKKEIPAVPLFLLGHSMGSFLAQGYIAHWGDQLKGAILSGTAGPADLMTVIGQGVAFLEKWRVGATGRSNLLNTLSFGSFNKQFQPARTAFDWLSRDEKEVDKYIADPFCGGIFPAAFFFDLLKFIRQIHNPAQLRKIPKNLPLYFFSGKKDPVGANTEGVKKLMKIYEKLGIADLSFNFYADGRHEMLNEINREIVIADVIKWLDIHCRSVL
jgi:alpha-beta hydrolase superfamily lysophospholipase